MLLQQVCTLLAWIPAGQTKMLRCMMTKDLTKYEPKIFLGLTARTLSCCALAIAVPVVFVLWFVFVLDLNFEPLWWIAYALSIPFWALGFWTPQNMKPEKFLPLLLRHKYGKARLLYTSKDRMPTVLSSKKGNLSNAYKKFRSTRNSELCSFDN